MKNADVIQAAGGLLWRETENGRELAIIHRPKLDDWALPKGKLEPGESWKAAALREVYEETGCKAEIENFVGCTCYTTVGTPKVVLYWNMTLTGKCNFQPSKEVDQLQWMKPEDAIQKLDYQTEQELIEKVNTQNG